MAADGGGGDSRASAMFYLRPGSATTGRHMGRTVDHPTIDGTDAGGGRKTTPTTSGLGLTLRDVHGGYTVFTSRMQIKIGTVGVDVAAGAWVVLFVIS